MDVIIILFPRATRKKNKARSNGAARRRLYLKHPPIAVGGINGAMHPLPDRAGQEDSLYIFERRVSIATVQGFCVAICPF